MKAINTFFALVFALSIHAQVSWYTISVPVQSKLHSISFGSANVGFIGGADSVLLKTTDGGKTWSRLAINVNANVGIHDITALQFLDENTGYMLNSNHLFKTTDGGSTWLSEQPNQTNMCFKNGIYFHDANNGFVGGSMCFQGATIGNKVNGNWDTILVVGGWDASESIQAIDFRNQQIGLAVGPKNIIYRTTNGGQTWDSVYNILDTMRLSDVVFVDDTLAYATYAQTGLEGALISTDGGLSWQRDFNLATFAYQGFNCAYKAGNNQPYLGGKLSWGNGGIIFNKTPSWWNYVLVDQIVNDLGGHSDSIVFAVGDSGYVGVNVLPQSIGLSEYQSVMDYRIYPNPVSDVLKIEMSEVKQPQRIILYDQKGMVLSRFEMYGSSIELDVSELSAGVYFIDIENCMTCRKSFVKK